MDVLLSLGWEAEGFAPCSRLHKTNSLNEQGKIYYLVLRSPLFRPHNPKSVWLVHVVLGVVLGWNAFDGGLLSDKGLAVFPKHVPMRHTRNSPILIGR